MHRSFYLFIYFSLKVHTDVVLKIFRHFYFRWLSNGNILQYWQHFRRCFYTNDVIQHSWLVIIRVCIVWIVSYSFFLSFFVIQSFNANVIRILLCLFYTHLFVIIFLLYVFVIVFFCQWHLLVHLYLLCFQTFNKTAFYLFKADLFKNKIFRFSFFFLFFLLFQPLQTERFHYLISC